MLSVLVFVLDSWPHCCHRQNVNLYNYHLVIYLAVMPSNHSRHFCWNLRSQIFEPWFIFKVTATSETSHWKESLQKVSKQFLPEKDEALRECWYRIHIHKITHNYFQWPSLSFVGDYWRVSDHDNHFSVTVYLGSLYLFIICMRWAQHLHINVRVRKCQRSKWKLCFHKKIISRWNTV